jgi:hypothetical protein
VKGERWGDREGRRREEGEGRDEGEGRRREREGGTNKLRN